MANIQVMRSFGQAVTETVQKRYFVGEQDVLLHPNLSPLFFMVTKIGNRKPVNVPRIEWIEDDYASKWGQANNGTTNLASNATQIPVADVTIFATSDLVAVPKAHSSSAGEEIFLVTAIAGTTVGTLTATRGIGGAGADTINATGDLLVVGSAYTEGASVGVPRSTTKSVKISYTQIFRRPTKITGTMAASAQYGPADERRFQNDKAFQELKREVEYAGLLGRASENGSAPNVRRTSMGLKSRITTNLLDVNTTLTETALLGFAESVFKTDISSDKKLFLASPKVISALDYFSNGNLNYGPDNDVLGLKVRVYRSTHGDFMVARDPALDLSPNSALGLGDEAFAVDPDSIMFHPLVGNGENRDTHLRQNIVKNGDDAYTDEWFLEGGFSIRHESRHGRIYECTAFA